MGILIGTTSDHKRLQRQLREHTNKCNNIYESCLGAAKLGPMHQWHLSHNLQPFLPSYLHGSLFGRQSPTRIW